MIIKYSNHDIDTNMFLLILGILLIVAGIVLAILYKKPPNAKYNTKVSLGIGITLIIIGLLLAIYGAYNMSNPY